MRMRGQYVPLMLSLVFSSLFFFVTTLADATTPMGAGDNFGAHPNKAFQNLTHDALGAAALPQYEEEGFEEEEEEAFIDEDFTDEDLIEIEEEEEEASDEAEAMANALQDATSKVNAAKQVEPLVTESDSIVNQVYAKGLKFDVKKIKFKAPNVEKIIKVDVKKIKFKAPNVGKIITGDMSGFSEMEVNTGLSGEVGSWAEEGWNETAGSANKSFSKKNFAPVDKFFGGGGGGGGGRGGGGGGGTPTVTSTVTPTVVPVVVPAYVSAGTVITSSSDSMSFTPPASDISVVFLGNIFGLVDGVLHGSGSQILGVIFSTFNSAVLALGGIVMMYIILVSTMNTAHEGQMLGQKWSSIWVPVRATMGLALLIPKSSGYCLMQIFVMWVVVQGVGVADKVWGTALDYLNRGGVIMQSQITPAVSREAGAGGAGNNSVMSGAGVILYGQVCMLALQTQLENQRKLYLEAKKQDSGPCAGTPSSPDMQEFCSTSVPDFLSTVNPLAEYSNYEVPMPHFKSGTYAALDGMCGTLRWSSWSSSDLSSLGVPVEDEEEEEEEEVSEQAGVLGRALRHATNKVDAEKQAAPRVTESGSIAHKVYALSVGSVTKSTGIEKAWNDAGDFLEGSYHYKSSGGGGGGISGGFSGGSLISDKSFMVSSPSSAAAQPTPFILSSADLETIKKSRAAGVEQMYLTLASTARAIVANDPEITPSGGNPSDYTSAVADYQFGVPQTSSRAECKTMASTCPNWGGIGSGTSVLLDGTELQDAATDYNAVMMPALKLLNDAQDRKKFEGGRAFISEAKRSGWILAGSYFFHLVRLNDSATANSDSVDSSSGLGRSSFDLNGVSGFCDSGSRYAVAVLCEFFNGTNHAGEKIVALFQGSGGLVSQPTFSSEGLTIIASPEEDASTVYGYANNAMLIDLPGQAGLKAPQLAFGLEELKLDLKADPIKKRETSSCKSLSCLPRALGDVLWNNVVRHIGNGFLIAIAKGATYLINYIIIWPLEHFIGAFEDGMKMITKPGVNPVLALALMGVHYINFAMDTWLLTLVASIAMSFLPSTLVILLMGMPLLAVWLGLMVGIGFITAYYIPFLPYMIFTFGALAWLIAVVEAMAAAPLVALGIAHPEGHDALGKSEQGLMILLNVFLRPAMMVIGFIASIAMCYVGVWLLNAGFSNVLGYLDSSNVWGMRRSMADVSLTLPWAKIFGFFFAILTYTSIYLTLVEKAFSLIFVLPDKVLRWIGGQQEGIGEAASQWTSDTKGKVEKGGEGMDKAMGSMQKAMDSAGTKIGKGTAKRMGRAQGAMSAMISSTSVKSGGGGGGGGAPPPPPS